METTTEDFWCMVWEQDVTTVVMLANLEENGKVSMLRRKKMVFKQFNLTIFRLSATNIGRIHLITVKMLPTLVLFVWNSWKKQRKNIKLCVHFI